MRTKFAAGWLPLMRRKGGSVCECNKPQPEQLGSEHVAQGHEQVRPRPVRAAMAEDHADRHLPGGGGGRQGDGNMPPAPPGGEAPAQLEQAAKPAELKQAEWLSSAYRESLEKERSRNVELKQELTNDHQLLAQERERSKGLEQQLAARQNNQQLLAQERERSKGLEQQLAARQNDQQLLAQERERSKGLEQQLTARQNDQQLLAQERERSKGLEQQLAARQSDQQLLVQERERNRGPQQQKQLAPPHPRPE